MPDPSALDPSNDLQVAWREGARALREGRTAEGLKLFRRIVEAGQANTAVWMGVAMAHRALTLKYRPQVFADMVGQDHVSGVLTRALVTGRVAPAYLFTGARGVGKTTCARSSPRP